MRHPVLRAGKHIDTCHFAGDDLETTFHLGIFLNEELLGICSFFKSNHNCITSKNQYQLRGMAILKEFQGKGLGNIILNFGENLLREQNTQVIWCNAREVAVNFYLKTGYKTIGNTFNIKDIGIHYMMYKNLNIY
ncbi:MAG: GNAT family N-acetyltransferase [Flaviramulus sp.]|nr:GNAT family N-acetyltransferase [Flaviramulus sp.]